MLVLVTIDPQSCKVLNLRQLDKSESAKETDGADGCRRIIELAGDDEVARLQSGALGVDPVTRKLVELPFFVLVLDEENVYIDKLELSSSAEILPNHVDLRLHGLGGDCDLPFGKYRWDADKSTLLPLPSAAQREGPSGVSLERAFLDFAEQFDTARLPKSTQAWIQQYHQSNDVKKKGR